MPPNLAASQDVNLSQGTSADPFSHSHTSFAFFRVPFAAWGRRKWLRFSLSVVTILLVALATYATYAVFYAVYHSPVFEPATASAPAADVMRGVNLGGWLVLEPWVTPSLFYQFEGRPANETAMDMHGFCRVLGAQEANRQLRIHWEKWVTEEHLAELASRGINALRVPVGDWMWTPYWPYHGCADGAVDQLKRVLRHSQKLGLRVLIDLHGARQLRAGPSR